MLFRASASQSRLAELNPYVTVEVSPQSLSLTSDLEFLRQYQVCVCVCVCVYTRNKFWIIFISVSVWC